MPIVTNTYNLFKKLSDIYTAEYYICLIIYRLYPLLRSPTAMFD
jgi:hypothetical protein